MDAKSPKIQSPKVIVLMVAYNQKNYVRQALESVLEQKTDFPYQIIIGDDCSTDGTKEIIASIALQNPGKIILHSYKKNIGGTKNNILLLNLCQNTAAKYIAHLDSDDYWTDPEKLQRQVDFLDRRADFVLCFTNWKMLDDNTGKFSNSWIKRKKTEWPLTELIKNDFIMHSSAMFRNHLSDTLPGWLETAFYGDWPFFVLVALHGKIGYLDRITAAYRIHAKGLWQISDTKSENIISMLENLKKELPQQYLDALADTISIKKLALCSYYLKNRQPDLARSLFDSCRKDLPLKFFLYRLILSAKLHFKN
jgi:glycosyltransferase involved in cell wall biosynthesis